MSKHLPKKKNQNNKNKTTTSPWRTRGSAGRNVKNAAERLSGSGGGASLTRSERRVLPAEYPCTELTPKQQQCTNIPRSASASAHVTDSSWPPPPFMKITLCWRQYGKGGGGEGEARNRRRTEPEAAFFFFFTYFPDPDARKPKARGGPAAATAAALRPVTPSSSADQPSLSQSHPDKNALRLGENSDPPPSLPPSTWLWSSFSIPFQRKVCGVVAQQSQGSSGLRSPSQVILGD